MGRSWARGLQIATADQLVAQAEAANEAHDFVEGARLAQLALADPSEAGAETAARAQLQVAIAALHGGDYEACTRACRAGLELAAHHADTLLLAQLRAQLGVALNHQGRPEEALQHAIEALGRVRGRTDRDALQLAATVNNNIAVILFHQRDHDDAVEHFARAVALTDELGEELVARVILRVNLGRVLLKLQRPDEARPWLEEAVRIAGELDVPPVRARAEEALAQHHHRHGDPETARRLAESAVAFWSTAGDPVMLASAQITRGEILHARGEPAAESALLHARDLADAAGHEDLRLHARQQLAALFEHAGRFEDACRVLHEVAALEAARFDALRSQQIQELKARHDAVRRSEELAQARDAAQAASRAKSAFLAVAGHELRTPLNAILGYGELLLDEIEIEGSLGPESARELGAVVTSAHNLLLLIERVLTYASLEDGNLRPEVEAFAPEPLLRDCVRIVRARAAEPGCRLVVELSAPGTMRSDHRRVQEIVEHLLDNALAFTGRGTVQLRAERVDRELVLEIEDEGPGIPPEAMHHLFDPFAQADMSYTRSHQGLGLGLALTARHCRLLGGSITVRPAPERGTVFAIRLPWELQ